MGWGRSASSATARETQKRVSRPLRIATLTAFAEVTATTWLAVSATNAKVVAGERENLFRLSIFKTEACADFDPIGPPVDLFSFCDA